MAGGAAVHLVVLLRRICEKTDKEVYNKAYRYEGGQPDCFCAGCQQALDQAAADQGQ